MRYRMLPLILLITIAFSSYGGRELSLHDNASGGDVGCVISGGSLFLSVLSTMHPAGVACCIGGGIAGTAYGIKKLVQMYRQTHVEVPQPAPTQEAEKPTYHYGFELCEVGNVVGSYVVQPSVESLTTNINAPIPKNLSLELAEKNDPEDWSDFNQQIAAQLHFLEQAQIDAELFYNFYGTDYQNTLHDGMREYLFEHAEKAIIPDDKEYSQRNFDTYLVQTIFQQGCAAAFGLNRVAMTDRGQLLFDIAQELFEMTMGIGIKVPSKTIRRAGEVFMHPVAYAQETVQGLCSLISFAAHAVVCTIKGPVDLLAGGLYMGIQERDDYWNAWEELAGEMHHACCRVGEINPLNVYDACSLRNVLGGLQTVNAGLDLVEEIVAHALVDAAVNAGVGTVCNAVVPVVVKVAAVQKGVEQCKKLKKLVDNKTKRVVSSLEKRKRAAQEWVKSHYVDVHQDCRAVQTAEGITVPVHGGADSTPLFHCAESIAPHSGEVIPSHIDPTKPFMQEVVPCVKDAEGVCQNVQSPYRGCHQVLVDTNKNVVQSILDRYVYPIKIQVSDDCTYILTRDDFKHILERHCIDCWNGSIKHPQSFFSFETGPDDIIKLLKNFVVKYDDEKPKVVKSVLGKFKFSKIIVEDNYTVMGQGNEIKTFYPDFLDKFVQQRKKK